MDKGSYVSSGTTTFARAVPAVATSYIVATAGTDVDVVDVGGADVVACDGVCAGHVLTLLLFPAVHPCVGHV